MPTSPSHLSQFPWLKSKRKPIKKTKPRTSCLLGCFGFPEKVIPEKKQIDSKSSKSRSFSWSKLIRMKKINDTKMVPVDATEKTEPPKKLIHKSKSKLRRKSDEKLSSNPPTELLINRTIPTVVETVPQETTYIPGQNIDIENKKSLDHLEPSKDNACRSRLLVSRKVNAIKTGLSESGSSYIELKPKSTRITSISYSIALPIQNQKKWMMDPLTRSQVASKKKYMSIDKFNPIVGMSIIIVTLVIMLLWGRLCAILCASAWCYFVPRLTSKNNSDSGDPDLSSKEYKRKVVLEGFLERNHRDML